MDFLNLENFLVTPLHKDSHIKTVKWIYEWADGNYSCYNDVPFNIFIINREDSSEWVSYSKQNSLTNAIYILYGPNYIYVGKSENADRIRDHVKDTNKDKFQYQMVFVSNNNNKQPNIFWDNTFMDGLEGILIKKVMEYSSFCGNSNPGILFEKMSRNFDSDIKEKYANSIAEMIMAAFNDIAMHSYIFDKNKCERVHENQDSDKVISTDWSLVEDFLGKKGYVNYKKENRLISYGASSEIPKSVFHYDVWKKQNGKFYVELQYENDNKDKKYEDAIKQILIEISKQAGNLPIKRRDTHSYGCISYSASESIEDAAKELEKFVNICEPIINARKGMVFSLEIQKFFKDNNGDNDKSRPYSFIDKISIIPNAETDKDCLPIKYRILKGSKFHESCVNKCFEGKYENKGKSRMDLINELLKQNIISKEEADEGVVYEFVRDVIANYKDLSLNKLSDMVGIVLSTWDKTWKNADGDYIEKYYKYYK